MTTVSSSTPSMVSCPTTSPLPARSSAKVSSITSSGLSGYWFTRERVAGAAVAAVSPAVAPPESITPMSGSFCAMRGAGVAVHTGAGVAVGA
jgi:hypothetical protein